MSITPPLGSLPDDTLLAASAEALNRSALWVGDTQLDDVLSELDCRLTELRVAGKNGRAKGAPLSERRLKRGIDRSKRSAIPGWLGLSRTAWYTMGALGMSLLLIVGGWRSGMFHSNGPRNTAMTTYTTRNGQRAEITLPDGSTVVLNVASRLDVPADFAAGNRALRLIGEALFTVRHHEGAPFTVSDGNTTVRVLGTRFVVRHYPTDTTTNVAVGDGKVVVHSIVLAEQQQIDVGRRHTGPVQPADLSRFGFATGVLAIDDMPLADAIVELNRWYDADIRLGDAGLATRRINGKFRPGSLTDLTNILGLMLDVRIVRKGQTLTIFQE